MASRSARLQSWKPSFDSAAEHQVVQAYLRRAKEMEARLQDVEGALERERELGRERIRQLRAQNADVGLIVSASRELAALPRDVASARERWTREMHENYERAKPLGGLPPHSQAYAGDPNGTPKSSANTNWPAATFWR